MEQHQLDRLLLKAAEVGVLPMVVKHLQEGANIEAHDVQLNTPLMLAVAFNRMEVVKYLLGQKANIHARNTHGHTPIIVAALKDRTEIAKVLLNQGANIEDQNHKEETALKWAKARLNQALVDVIEAHKNQKELDRVADVNNNDNLNTI